MSTVVLAALLIGLAGVGCTIAVLSRLWPDSTTRDDPVGARAAPASTKVPKTAPTDLRSIVFDDFENWARRDRWLAMTQRLDVIEIELGGAPTGEPPPEKFDRAWLDRRVSRLESLAGSMPAPYPTSSDQHSRGT